MIKLQKILSEIKVTSNNKIPFSSVKQRLIVYFKEKYPDNLLVVNNIDNIKGKEYNSFNSLINFLEDYLGINNDDATDIILDLIINFEA